MLNNWKFDTGDRYAEAKYIVLFIKENKEVQIASFDHFLKAK